MGTDTLYRTGRTQIFAVLAIVAAVASVLFAINAQAAPALPQAEFWMVGDTTERTAADSGVEYGDHVAFDYDLSGKVAKKHVMSVGVHCYQGSETVYSWFGEPLFEFPLHDQTQNGSGWNGGDADCVANLQYKTRRSADTIARYRFKVSGNK